MSYPENTWLTRPIRRTIMVGLITLFFVISPLIILYTTGFRYDFVHHRVEQTGVISIDAKPADVEVYLNTVRIKKTMPIRLANRAPGTYRLILKKDGYMPWERDITVTSQQTTYIKNVTLFQEALPESYGALPPGHIDAMSGSADGTLLLLTIHDDSTTDIYLLNRKNRRSTMIKRMPQSASPTIAWSPSGLTAIILLDNGQQKTVDVVSGVDEKIVATLPFPIATHIRWSWTGDRPSFLVDGVVMQIDAGTKKNISTASETAVWYVDTQDHIWLYNKANSTLVDTHDAGTSIAAPDNTAAVLDVNNSRAIFATDQAITVISRTSANDTTVIAGGHAQWNPNTREWIVSSATELWTVYEDGHAVLLNRTSDTIASAAPLDPYGVLLIATPTSLIGFNPGYYVTHTLLTHAQIESISVDYKNRSIAFLGTIGEHRDLYLLAY